MKKNISKYAAIVLLSLLAVTVAYAVLKYTERVPNTATIVGYEIKLWRTDNSGSIVTSIAWGEIERDANKTTEEVFSFTQKLVMKNTGDRAAYVGWKLNASTPLPSGVSLIAEGYVGGGWYAFPENSFDQSMSTQLAIGALSPPLRWTLIASNGAARTSFTFDILLLGATTSQG